MIDHNDNQSQPPPEEDADKLRIRLKSLILKKIIKENHDSPIQQVAFNWTSPEYYNLVATLGNTQVNIYDNEHFGKHLDLMLNFVNEETPYHEKEISRRLKCLVWLKAPEGHKDTHLAVGGKDRLIHIISISCLKVISLLTGHEGTIIDLAAHPVQSNFLLSVSKDKTMRLWNLNSKKTLFVFDAEAHLAMFHPGGQYFISGGKKGILTEWHLHLTNDTAKLISHADLEIDKKNHTSAIDCIRFINDEIVITKSVDGRLMMWRPETGELIRSLKVPGKIHTNTPSRFDVSRDGHFLCVGNGQGNIFVYDIKSGSLVNSLEHRRARTPVRCCAFSRDCWFGVFPII
eukprot:TRINITY_DN1883_c0_g1_i3.p1 TRINITY_DN1883_c0_g1~~TRINITY_DN1883_c0_g1_i3.p1  ORF type:complete len:345 (-),score=49.47 TRINITY_DN1883_c0_g1_i3:180-1214(-)